MILQKRNDNETVATINYYGVQFIGVFERLKNSSMGHPRYKVRVIRESWINCVYETWCYTYTISQVYESLKDALLDIIIKEGLR